MTASEGPVTASELISCDQGINETGEVTLRAPLEVGKHQWSVLFKPQPVEAVVHAEISLPVPVRTEAHRTSLAIWDVPSPVVMGDPFMVKVGAKCVMDCELQGRKIEVYGGSGEKFTTAEFGDAPWPGSDALYWAEVKLVAPVEEGLASWSVEVVERGSTVPIPDAGSSSRGLSSLYRRVRALYSSGVRRHLRTCDLESRVRGPRQGSGGVRRPHRQG